MRDYIVKNIPCTYYNYTYVVDGVHYEDTDTIYGKLLTKEEIFRMLMLKNKQTNITQLKVEGVVTDMQSYEVTLESFKQLAETIEEVEKVANVK